MNIGPSEILFSIEMYVKKEICFAVDVLRNAATLSKKSKILVAKLFKKNYALPMAARVDVGCTG